jgi:ATP-dependent DNA helicase PIF1
LSPESIATLKSRVGLDWSALPIKPTLIFSRNKDVDRINQENMLAIEGPSKTFTAQTVYKTATKLTPELQGLLDRLDKDSTYESVLELKVGAQVMLITNSLASRSPDLVNGSRGVVTGFSSAGLPLVQFASGPPIPVDRVTWNLPEGVGRSQIPLRIAYAITVHKSQGVSLDSALIDIGSSVFEYGQAYVALSRVRSLEGLYIHRLQPHAIVCHPKVRAFYS